MWRGKKILFQLSGSIACYKACDVISKLAQHGAEVQVVATVSALKFVGVMTLEGLTQKKVMHDVFAEGDAHAHIHLMKWADVIILCPASANKISELATGLAHDLVGNLFLAFDFKRPYLVIPSMNEKMYQHPVIQKNIMSLKELGLKFLTPATGHLACGDIGIGRMPETNVILEELSKIINEDCK